MIFYLKNSAKKKESKVQQLKRQLGATTLEDLFVVVRRPHALGYDVDRVKTLLYDIHFGMSAEDKAELEEVFKQALLALESMRASITLLRSWGEGWRRVALELADRDKDFLTRLEEAYKTRNDG